jgi:hypothetical protein
MDILITKDNFLDLDGCHHYWPNSHRYGGINIDDITCNDDGCLREDIIICLGNIRQWFHSLYYWDIWVSSFSFRFTFYRLCIEHYCASSIVLVLIFYYQQHMSIAL